MAEEAERRRVDAHLLGLTTSVHEEYNALIFRIGLFKDRIPESQLKSQLKAAEESFNVDAVRVLSAQIAASSWINIRQLSSVLSNGPIFEIYCTW